MLLDLKFNNSTFSCGDSCVLIGWILFYTKNGDSFAGLSYVSGLVSVIWQHS